MSPTLEKSLFSEPKGRLMSLFYFGIATVLLSMSVYFTWVLGSEDSLPFSLVMGVGFALQGIAESRPKSQRRTAGVFRLMAILVYLGALVAIGLVPGLLG